LNIAGPPDVRRTPRTGTRYTPPVLTAPPSPSRCSAWSGRVFRLSRTTWARPPQRRGGRAYDSGRSWWSERGHRGVDAPEL